MKIVGTMLARNESWVIRTSLYAALNWCDEVVVLIHASDDGTEDAVSLIRDQSCGRVSCWLEDDPVWREMDFRQSLLEMARDRRATHIAIVDADEVVTGNLLGKIRGFSASLVPGGSLALPMICPWRGLWRHRVDATSPWGAAQTPVVFCDGPGLSWRPAEDGYQHHHRLPYGSEKRSFTPFVRKNNGGVFHLQWTDWERLLWKQRLYVLNEAGKYPAAEVNARYRASVSEEGLALDPVPLEWWWPYRERMLSTLVSSPSPCWQEVECRRLAAELPRSSLEGLDLFGWDPLSHPPR